MGDFNPDLFVPVTSVTQMWGRAIIKSILTTFRLTWSYQVEAILLCRKSYCLLGPESISKGWTAFTETGPIYEDLEREEDDELEVGLLLMHFAWRINVDQVHIEVNKMNLDSCEIRSLFTMFAPGTGRCPSGVKVLKELLSPLWMAWKKMKLRGEGQAYQHSLASWPFSIEDVRVWDVSCGVW